MKKEISRGNEIYGEDVFQILTEYEISRPNRYPAPLTMLHIEITPSALDKGTLRAAPKLFASALNAHLRSVDIPSGMEHNYWVLLPTTDASGARAVCERLLSVFRNKFDTREGNSIFFSLNIGAATHQGGPPLTSEILFKQAESALKKSKTKGANTYVFFSEI